MRPLSFRPDDLRALLLRHKIATLEELKQALGTPVDVTVFRKLKPLDYLTSGDLPDCLVCQATNAHRRFSASTAAT